MGRVPAPFCLGVSEHPMFRPVDEEVKIIQVVMSFPEGFRLSSAALAECRVWAVEDVGCNVDRLMLQNVFQPGYVERSFPVVK